jgi:LysM repeat protein
LTHQVQGGDTLSAIAGQYQTTVADILALNPDVEPESLQVGLVLLIPAGPLTPTPTATLDPSLPTPTPGNFTVHTVAPGETLGSIAQAYDVSVALIREVNNLPIGDDTIFTNQSLVIPLGTPIPSPTPTRDPNATPTPVPLYAAVALLNPPDGATLAGDQQPVALQWASVSVLREDEWYAVTLSPSGGVDPSTQYTRATAWRVPFNLLLSAKDAAGEFRWEVHVVRETKDQEGKRIYEEAGLPGEERSFTWLAPTPTPIPTDTPSPTPAP